MRKCVILPSAKRFLKKSFTLNNKEIIKHDGSFFLSGCILEQGSILYYGTNYSVEGQTIVNMKKKRIELVRKG